MNNNIILENYLLVLKSNVEVFVHGTLESSNDDCQEMLKSCLLDTINSQRNTYVLMVNSGIYNVSNVMNSDVLMTLNKINSNN